MPNVGSCAGKYKLQEIADTLMISKKIVSPKQNQHRVDVLSSIELFEYVAMDETWIHPNSLLSQVGRELNRTTTVKIRPKAQNSAGAGLWPRFFY